MLFDYLSDLHLDFYFRHTLEVTVDTIAFLMDPIIYGRDGTRVPGEAFIIAGDISHINSLSVSFIKACKERYPEIKYWIMVTGNHDFYITRQSDTGKLFATGAARVKDLTRKLNKIDGVTLLDGNVIEINGFRIGGAMGWYDGQYAKPFCPQLSAPENAEAFESFINTLWSNSINDRGYIPELKTYNQFCAAELAKLEKVVAADVHLMVTHINPSINPKHINKKYRNDASSCFFTFDGSKLLKATNAQYWVFGHVHDPIEFEVDGVKCVSNQLGYPGESDGGRSREVKQFELIK